MDLLDEASIAEAAGAIRAAGRPVQELFIATGMLSHADAGPERALSELDPGRLAQVFAVNAIGPALVLKHFAPLIARDRPTGILALSARVGSIGDNRLGGWHGYRASKAALNQIVRTAAVELARTHPRCACVLVHPGTVDTPLSRPFRKSGLRLQRPEDAAARLLDLAETLRPNDSGRFLDADGRDIPW